MEKEFSKYLETTSLNEKDKIYIRSIFEYLEGKHPSKFANRSFLFEGEPGIGKTYLSKKLVKSVKCKVLFFGQTYIKGENIKKISTLKELLDETEKLESGIVYVDDLRYLFNFNELDDLTNEDRQMFMRLIENFTDNNKKTVLIMTTNFSEFLEDSLKDRLDVKIDFGLPSNKNKASFLKENFAEYLGEKEIKYLSENTIGYNYRDLPQLLKISYYKNSGKIDINSLKKALEIYTPSSLSNSDVKQGIKTKLKDLFINNKTRKQLKRTSLILKNKDQLEDLSVNKSNFIIFEGPPGVGKTFSAHALAGELGVPLIKVDAQRFFFSGGINPGIFSEMKRFRNSVILLDDLDKIINGDSLNMNDGNAINSILNSNLDEIDEGAIVVLSVNDSNRLGRALKDRCSLIQFNNPEFSERKLFFEKQINNSKIKFNLSKRELAEITKESNYRDLQKTWNDLILYAIENNLKIINKKHLNLIFPENKINNKLYPKSMCK